MAEMSDNNRSESRAQGSSDHSLIRRYRNGEQDAATELYTRYAHRLAGLARNQTSATLAKRVPAEDVVQSVFRTFFRRVAENGYDVPPGDELWQLLLVLTLNKIRSLGTFHSAKKRDAAATFSLCGEEFSLTSKSSDSSLRILELTIDELLDELQPTQRDMIRLRIKGYTVPSIAEETSRSQRSVERVLQRFRARLSQIINDSPEMSAASRAVNGTPKHTHDQTGQTS